MFVRIIRAMRFIAPDDFSQGLRNPLKIPGGAMHVSKGTIFSIGPDDVPFDRAGRGLQGEDLETFRTFFGAGRLVPLDSDKGREIFAECERARKLEIEKERSNRDSKRSYKEWYERPIGLIIIGVIIIIIGGLLTHYFPQWLHS
jgi:hypothetical protein